MTELEKSLSDKTFDFNELITLSQAAAKERDGADQRLKRIAANPGATPTVSDMMVGDIQHAPSVNSDLQFDLRSRQDAAELASTKEKEQEVSIEQPVH